MRGVPSAPWSNRNLFSGPRYADRPQAGGRPVPQEDEISSSSKLTHLVALLWLAAPNLVVAGGNPNRPETQSPDYSPAKIAAKVIMIITIGDSPANTPMSEME